MSIRNLLNEAEAILTAFPIEACSRHTDGRKNSQEDEKTVISTLIKHGMPVKDPGSRTTTDLIFTPYENEVVDIKSIKLSSPKKDRSNCTSSPKAYGQLLDPEFSLGNPNWGDIAYTKDLTGPVRTSYYLVVNKENTTQVLWRDFRYLHKDTYIPSFANIMQLNWVNELNQSIETLRSDDEFRKIVNEILSEVHTENYNRTKTWIRKD